MTYILILIIAILSIIAMVTDIKRREIDDWVSIVGGFIILGFICFGFIDRTVLSYNLQPTQLTLISSLISGLVIFILFLLIPVGGGDMKFLSFIALYFGVGDTLMIFGFSCFIMFFYSQLTNRRYIRQNPQLFDKCNSRAERRKLLMRREVPMMVGICPATIIFLLMNMCC